VHIDDHLSNFKVEAYKALREEMHQHYQAMGAVLGVALTATAAIGAFGLSHTGNRDALLILPFVLCGLGLVQVDHGIQVRRLGEYIRTYLWPTNTQESQSGVTPPPSYEEWIARMRTAQGLFPTKATGALGQAVVFVLPSVAALLVTASKAWGSPLLAIVWGGALLVLIAAIALSAAVENNELGPSDLYVREGDRPPESLLPKS
jgi:hypothetical protein